jgi:hypothetical protein
VEKPSLQDVECWRRGMVLLSSATYKLPQNDTLGPWITTPHRDWERFTIRQMASSTDMPSRFGTAMSQLLNTPPDTAHFDEFPWWPNRLHSFSAPRLGLIT